MDKYMSRRNGTRRRPREGGGNSSRSMASSPSTICCDTSRDSSSLTTPPSASRPPPSPCARRGEGAALSAAANAPKDGDSRQREDGPTPRWEDHHVSVVREAIFGPLAGFARDALEAERSAAAETHAAAADGRLLLFNEQYVVKPPQSSIEFGWHTVRGVIMGGCGGGCSDVVVLSSVVAVVVFYPTGKKIACYCRKCGVRLLSCTWRCSLPRTM